MNPLRLLAPATLAIYARRFEEARALRLADLDQALAALGEQGAGGQASWQAARDQVAGLTNVYAVPATAFTRRDVEVVRSLLTRASWQPVVEPLWPTPEAEPERRVALTVGEPLAGGAWALLSQVVASLEPERAAVRAFEGGSLQRFDGYRVEAGRYEPGPAGAALQLDGRTLDRARRLSGRGGRG
jgi:hypothetical protein